MGHRRGRPTGEGGVPLHSLMAEKIEALSMNLAGLHLRVGIHRGRELFLAIGWCRWCGDRCRSPACPEAYERAGYCVLLVFEWPVPGSWSRALGGP
jgi:hypothetical protein